jgi:gluconate 2-dehydrogenase gamma chain
VEPAYKISRRKFLGAALAAAAATGASVACDRTSSPWRFLTVEEARTLAAACDEIIPPDESAGAAWAGVVTYIDRQLCGPFRHLRDTYRQGIAALEKSSRILYGSNFAVIQSVKRGELLNLVERGQAPPEAWAEVSSTEFFGLLVDHSMQGFYGDPRHGGNRAGAGWKTVGLSYPPIRGRLKYDLSKG